MRSGGDALREALECGGCGGGENWYVNKHRWIARRAKRAGADLDVACVAYAVMSQNASVSQNDLTFVTWLATGEVRSLAEVERRVRLAESGDVAGALRFKNAAKIASFAENLRHPWAVGPVTVDRHAADALTGDRAESRRILGRVRLSGYRWLEAQYVAAAAALGMLPSGAQARVWVHRTECGRVA